MIRATVKAVAVIGVAAGQSNMIATVPETMANFEDPKRAGSLSPGETNCKCKATPCG